MKLTSYPARAVHGASLPSLPSALARLCALVIASAPAAAQFGGQQVISTQTVGLKSVYSTDLDGDGDADVLSASMGDNKIAWYENLGAGAFGPQQVIASDLLLPRSVYATDLDGDGDADVLAASNQDDKIVWYENEAG